MEYDINGERLLPEGDEWKRIRAVAYYRMVTKEFLGGSFEKLQAQLPYEGVWSDHGAGIKRFDLSDDPTEQLYWWPNPGYILYLFNHPEKLVNGSDLIGREIHRTDWTLIASGKYKGISLPELFFRQPDRFLSEKLLEQRFMRGLESEHAEILAKVRGIRLPMERPEEFVVEHKFKWREYCGFRIVRERPIVRLERGAIVRERYLDLTVPGHFHVFRQSVAKAVQLLQQILTGDSKPMWRRSDCERFFNDDALFVNPNRRQSKGLILLSEVRSLGIAEAKKI